MSLFHVSSSFLWNKKDHHHLCAKDFNICWVVVVDSNCWKILREYNDKNMEKNVLQNIIYTWLLLPFYAGVASEHLFKKNTIIKKNSSSTGSDKNFKEREKENKEKKKKSNNNQAKRFVIIELIFHQDTKQNTYQWRLLQHTHFLMR